MTSNDEPVVAELDELHDDFIYFVRVNDVDEVRQLLGNDALNLNARNELGNTALHMAAANGHADLIDLLMQHSATIAQSPGRAAIHVDARNQLGNTPLSYAAQQNQLGPVRRLLHFGANVNSVNESKQTPLDLALLSGAHDDVCNALVNAGAKAFDSLQDLANNTTAAANITAATTAAPAAPAVPEADMASILGGTDAVEMDDDSDNDDNHDDDVNDKKKASEC
jgi:ankyrin repeat protein